MNKIKFCISSHKNYYDLTYPKLIPNMLENGIPPDDIYFFIGGYNSYSKLEDNNNINVFTVDHNSIDFTGLVSVMDLNLKSDYWFLLHDTSYIGSNFYYYLLNFDYNNELAIPLTNESSMNIGLYHQLYLDQIKDELLTKFKNKSDNPDDIHNFKKYLVNTEDHFLINFKNKFLNPESKITEGPIDVYNSGVLRVIEHFNQIDLHKIKANWYVKEQYTVII